MFVIRPVATADLDALLELATQTGFGLTTLPRDAEFLTKRIKKSQRSFADVGDEPAGEQYLFVLEDLATGRVMGTGGILAKVGGFEPFYAYRLETTVHESAFLCVRKEIRLLHLVSEHNGPCEMCSLFLAPAARGRGPLGRLLSLSRFLFMAEHPRSFDPIVIGEMRGVIDDLGRSVFWDAIGKHFFEIDFPKADYLSLVNKRFIADLMPKHPIYVTLLPESAQAVIGQVHEQTQPALRFLEGEGFRFENMVDIFEAGPIVTCPLSQIRTVRDSRRAKVMDVRDDCAAPAGAEALAPRHVVCNTRGEFRATLGTLEVLSSGDVVMPTAVAEALHVTKADEVRYATLRA